MSLWLPIVLTRGATECRVMAELWGDVAAEWMELVSRAHAEAQEVDRARSYDTGAVETQVR